MAKVLSNIIRAGSGSYTSTGTGNLVLSNSPTLVTPALGAASASSLSLTSALTVANGGTGVATLTGIVKGSGTSAFTAATAGTDYSAGTSSLATGILKSTTSTGALTIAVAADFPTLNQNTTGTAAGLSATLAVGSGGTGATTLTGILKGNGTGAFTAATAGTDYVAPGGSLGTPSSGTLTNCTFPTLNQNTTGTAAGLSATLVVGSGGTGSTTLAANNVLLGNGTSALQVVAPGASGNVLTSNGTTWTSTAPSTGVNHGGTTVTSSMSADITLTSSSNQFQILTPTTHGLKVILPNATTISTLGNVFTIQNTEPAIPIAVMDSAGTNVGWVVSSFTSNIILVSNSVSAGTWRIQTGDESADGGVFFYDYEYVSNASTGIPYYHNGLTFALSKDAMCALTATSSSLYQIGTYSTKSTGTGYYYSVYNDSNTNNTQLGNDVYCACPVGSAAYFAIYQDTTNNLIIGYAVSVASDVYPTTTKGTEINLGSSNNAIKPYCIAVSSTLVLASYENFGGKSTIQAISISGSTCTAGTAVVNTANSGHDTQNRIISVSSTLAFWSVGGTIYPVNISGTTITLGTAFSGTPTSIYGLTAVSATTFLVCYSTGVDGTVNVALATYSAGSITLGTPVTFNAKNVANYITANPVATGTMLIIIPPVGASSRVAKRQFILARYVNSTIQLSKGILPETYTSGKSILYPQSGVCLFSTTQGLVTSYIIPKFRKAAITGGV